MVKTITKIGNSHGIILDSALLEMSRLQAGDEVNVEVHEGGTITITPVRQRPDPRQVSTIIEGVMKDYRRTMKKLS